MEFSVDENQLSEYEKLMVKQSLCRDLRNLEDKINFNPEKVNKSLIGPFDVSFVYRENSVEVIKLEKVSSPSN